jgi:hypothetical protein
MATIVIVPAAFHGGWRWKEVRVGLQAAGHEVYATTLTGLGERSHVEPPQMRASWEERAREIGEGWRVPPWSPPDWRSAPHPLKSLQQPLRLTGTGSSTVPGAFVHCTVKRGEDPLARSVDRARERGWPVFELATGHVPLYSDADRTALLDLLLTIV